MVSYGLSLANTNRVSAVAGALGVAATSAASSTTANRKWRCVMCSLPRMAIFVAAIITPRRRRASQHVARWPDRTLGEPRESERGDVERRLAVEDQLGHEPARDRAHREPVAAEAGGEHEAFEPRRLAEHRHEIR